MWWKRLGISEQQKRHLVLERLAGRDILSLRDVSPEEIKALISLAIDMKAERKRGHQRMTLQGKSVALLFFKPSTRTRISFEVAAYELGAHPLILHTDELQLGRGETIEHTAAVISRYVHALIVRTYGQDEIRRFASASSIPIVNALTDDYHPVQILADLQTMTERFGDLAGRAIAYVGDGNNVAHSIMIGAGKMGMDVRIATPDQYMPDEAITAAAREEVEAAGGHVTITHDPVAAVEGADVVYTDTWVSMGQDESEREQKLAVLKDYQVNTALLQGMADEAVIMHCLPAHVGEEISEDAFEDERCIVFDQAENRLHIQKALLASIIA